MNYCTLKPYVPGNPKSETLVDQVWLRANGIERDSDCYLGAYEYGRLIAELQADHDAPKTEVPMSLKFGVHPCLHVINAGTDDRLVVALKNRDAAGARDFREKLERLRVA